MFQAWERLRLRVERVAALLEGAGVLYALVGGRAVAYWVARIDPGAVRNSPDVDLLIQRPDFPTAQRLLQEAGFAWQAGLEPPTFAEDIPREPVHLLFANEKVRPDHLFAAPGLDSCVVTEAFRVLSLEPLVRMKLTSFRTKDRMHIRDLMDVGLVDHTWPARLPPELATRLQQVLDDPHG